MERRASPTQGGGADRLESWKQIAEYLHRDVRTVQRWEQIKGLPVRRLPGGERARIFALQSELDEWWNSRGIHVVREEQAGNTALRRLRPRHLASACAIAGAVLLAGITYWLLRGAGSTPPLRVTQLTSLPGFVRSPTFSPDGRQVAFSWNGASPDNFDLYIKDVAGGEPRRLTSDSADDGYPAWSPDGHFIAFLRWRLAHLMDGPELLVIPQAGGAEQLIGNGVPFPELDPVPLTCWTPDSRHLIGLRPDLARPTALFLTSIESHQVRQLTTPPVTSAGDDSAVVSPDGRRIVFVRRLGPGGGNIFVLDLNPDYSPRGEPRQITHESCCVSNPLWTGDGAEILYVRQEDATSSVYRIAANGGGRARALSSISPAAPYLMSSQNSLASASAQLAISRQGDKLVYVGGSLRSDIWRIDLSRHRPDGSLVISPWLPSSRVDARPQISPDGRRVAFVSSRGGNLDIWVANADSSNPVQVTVLRGPEAHAPRWSPDSKQIVFHANTDGSQDLYLVSAAGGVLKRLTHGPGNNMWASWSHDGQWIYFASNRTGRYQCWRMPVRGGPAVQITKGGGYGGFESADGKILYYPKFYMTGIIWSVPVVGGEEKPVSVAVVSQRGPANFVVRPEGIYTFATDNPLLGSRLQLYRFSGGKIETLGHIAVPLGRGGMTISPDGHCVMFTDSARQRGDVMLVENFR